MTLAPGTRLGPYEIVSALGAGGMGEVYRARDPKLRRDVALKVLLPEVADNPERLARFRREAQTLAALNHPNIAHIHGLEETGDSIALVMELVEGEDLVDRIARGPIPLDEALPIARQIAEALEAAHEQGIVHRDLKPANIKVRADGTVKVLDFGLAKAIEGAGDPGRAGRGRSTGSSDPPGLPALTSPTLTSPAQMTGVGVILGTAAYMSPEQARGQGTDRRADMWAFGVVLYEMLTGVRPFEGTTVSDTIAHVLTRVPDWTALPTTTPTTVRTLLRRCLQRDRRNRLPDAASARLEILEGIEPDPPVNASADVHQVHGKRYRVVLGSAVLAAVSLVAGAAAGRLLPVGRAVAERPFVTRTVIPAASNEVIGSANPDPDIAMSQDGRRVAHIGTVDGQVLLSTRSLDALDPLRIAGPRSPRAPFFSPDAEWVGFFEGTQALKKVRFSGGPAVVICRTGSPARGASWGPDNTIVFATAARDTGLMEVGGDGGTPRVLTRPDAARGEVDHIQPDVLPNGNAVLFTIVTGGAVDNRAIGVFDRRTSQYQTLIPGGTNPHYAAPGHLLFMQNGTLRAVVFDPSSLRVSGAPVPVATRVVEKTVTGAAQFGVSRTGTLIYLSGDSELATGRTLVWMDRQGREEPVPAPARGYTYPRLSPDGRRVALEVRDQEFDIYVWDFDRGVFTRATFDPTFDQFPAWSPDGTRILFGDGTRLLSRAADGTGTTTTLASAMSPLYPLSSSRGHGVVALHTSLQTGADVVLVPVSDNSASATSGEARVLLNTDAQEQNGEVSPDGAWLAYESTESGTSEVYVRPFPDVERGRWQVSGGGGSMPLWARSGRELFFRRLDGRLVSVPIEPGAAFTVGTPSLALDHPIFSGVGTGRTYDVSPDGRRFLLIKEPPAASTPQLTLVQNVLEELTR